MKSEHTRAPLREAQLLLYAPNVHTGGGLVLLRELLGAWQVGRPLRAWLDDRARPLLELPPGTWVRWVRPSPASRLAAEFGLASATRKCDSVLCFHGLPPLLRIAGGVYVFMQNRLYLGQLPLRAFAWRTRLRLRFEQAISRWLRHRVAGYVVQTPSMARALKAWFGPRSTPIRILPFAPASSAPPAAVVPKWDFIYVADGEAHKNHRRLIEAWSLLAQEGLRPSLALTLSTRDQVLTDWVAERAQGESLNLVDLGVRPHSQIAELYASASALIFPSLGESLGLPLVEARQAGLPILAAELDYVRDVCDPTETFDPMSSVSIARAVRRFLNQAELPLTPMSASDFLASFMEIAERES